jgi:hypothetical protein
MEPTNAILAECREKRAGLPDRSHLDILCVCNGHKAILGDDDEPAVYRQWALSFIGWSGAVLNHTRPADWDAAKEAASKAFDNKSSLGITWAQVLLVQNIKKTRLPPEHKEHRLAYFESPFDVRYERPLAVNTPLRSLPLVPHLVPLATSTIQGMLTAIGL